MKLKIKNIKQAEKTAAPPVAEPLGAPAPEYSLAELVGSIPEQAARQALLRIAECLDGQEWGADTLEEIGHAMNEAGIPLRDIE